MSAPAVSSYELAPQISLWRVFIRNRASVAGALVLLALVLIALLGPFVTPYDPHSTGAGDVMQAPGAKHWFGTDELGRDVLSRVCIGVGTSLLVGLIAAVIATSIAVLVGAVAGFHGGFVDDLLMRATEVFQVIPRFFLAILLVAFFGASVLNIILAIGVLSWPEVARIVRAEFLSLKSRQFVSAARVAGAGTWEVIFTEILPNAMGPVVVNATLQVGQAMLLEAGLSYLGLGDPSQISLGLMLYQSQEIMRSAWWATAFPGLFIFLAVLSANLAGDGLNDIFNPRARGR
jgi:peptide/nickel transport system permease protein